MGEEFLSLKPYNFYIAKAIIVRQTLPTLLVYKTFWVCRRASDRCWQIQIWCYLDHWPCRMRELAVKEEVFDCLARAEKLHFLLPCELWWVRLSLASTTPLQRYHVKILTFSGILDSRFVYYCPLESPSVLWGWKHTLHRVDHRGPMFCNIPAKLIPALCQDYRIQLR